MNEGNGQRHTSSTTITSRAFTFDRPSNDMGYIAILYCTPPLVVGPRLAEEEVEGASTTRKGGIGGR